MLDAASELESTPATPAVLNRDDAGAPRADSPRSDIHTPKSPRSPLTYCSRRATDAPDTCASIRVEDDGGPHRSKRPRQRLQPRELWRVPVVGFRPPLSLYIPPPTPAGSAGSGCRA